MTSVAPGEHRIIANKYRLLDLLGRGGMGSVWRAEHLALNSHVAVKLIAPSIMANPDAMARFLREAQAAAALRSPHVVQILDYGVDGDTPYIAMELLEGESLSRRLERVGRLSPRATADVISQVSRAIARAHEHGIVHRDLKPDNIFITANDDSEIAKVLDFGIAKQVMSEGHGMTQTGAVLGTLYYMSPEQTEGARDVDYRSDLWALSVIAFECLLGRRPFDDESIGALVLAICTRPIPVPSQLGKVPIGFDAWFSQGVSRQRQHRFESARELAASLRKICGVEDSSGGGLREPAASAAQWPAAGTQVVAPTHQPAAHTSAALTFPSEIDADLAPPLNRPRWGLIGALGGLLVLVVAITVPLLRGGGARDASSRALAADSARTSLTANVAATEAATQPATEASVALPVASAASLVAVPETVASSATTAGVPSATPVKASVIATPGTPRAVTAKPQTKDSSTQKSPQDKARTTPPTRPTPKVDLGI